MTVGNDSEPVDEVVVDDLSVAGETGGDQGGGPVTGEWVAGEWVAGERVAGEWTSVAGDVAGIRAELAAMGADLATLVRDRDAVDERARARELVIAHQRDELDALRAERRGGTLRPLVVALQKLRAELVAEAVRSGAAGAATGSGATFEYFADTVLDILERCGCHRVPVSVGEAVVTGRHQIVRTEATGADGHGRVTGVLAEGWTDTESGRVLAPAKVVVGRHPSPDLGTTEPGAPEEPGND